MDPRPLGAAVLAAWPTSQKAAFIAAGVFVLLVIWVRPPPTTLYGIDAGCYARVAATMAARPISQWPDVRMEDQPFYEHPPGFMFLEALAFRVLGAETRTAVSLARLLTTIMAGLIVLQAYQVAGPRAALGTLVVLPALSSFLFESQNPMLETPLSIALLLAFMGAWNLEGKTVAGCALFALGSLAAFWIKGPPALAAGAYLSWSAWRRRTEVWRIAVALCLALVIIGLSVICFEHARSRYGLPPFFRTYWYYQVMPSFLHGRHNPISSPFYYLPIVWRWQTMGVVLAIPAIATVWVHRRKAPSAMALAEIGLLWGSVLLVGFSVARQKYQWYLHPMIPGFAWLGGALATCWPQKAPTLPQRRIGIATLGSLTTAYCLILLLKPDLMHKRHIELEALHAAKPPMFMPGEARSVAYCGPDTWRESHVARFLWRADLLPCFAQAPYRFDGKTLARVAP